MTSKISVYIVARIVLERLVVIFEIQENLLTNSGPLFE